MATPGTFHCFIAWSASSSSPWSFAAGVAAAAVAAEVAAGDADFCFCACARLCVAPRSRRLATKIGLKRSIIPSIKQHRLAQTWTSFRTLSEGRTALRDLAELLTAFRKPVLLP